MAEIDVDHFWKSVTVAGPDDCWEWIGSQRGHGYGGYKVGDHWRSAHSVSLELSLGRPLQEGMIACHRCDNRRCCNPAHLWEGTHHENHMDKVEKGRWYGGEWTPERRKKTGDRHRARQRYVCDECGLVSEASGMSSHRNVCSGHPEHIDFCFI